MAVNKVQRRDGTVEMDITDTTATPKDVSEGEVFYDSKGIRQVGTGRWMEPVTNPVAGEILITDANGQAQSSSTDLDQLLFDVDAGRNAFKLQDFSQEINITIPSVTADVANTSIPNMDIDLNVIDPSGELNQNYAIAGIAKYEIYDAASGGSRLNAFPVCSFSMNSQRTLRMRCMVGGSTSKTARRIQGALLLKHR